MDLWDVAKLMGRRWYIALPMLLVTVAAALWTVSTVKPDYTATTNVTLLPPTVRNDSPTGKAQKVNPWDTESLTVATLTYLNSKRLHDSMGEQGYSDVWAADTDIRFRTLIIIKVTAPGRDEAQRTARKLQDLVTEEVARQQERYALKPGEEITTIPFDNGDNLETATSKVKRALIVVIGVGLILMVAVTVGVDALMRWRAARRRGPDAAGTAEPAPAPRQSTGPAVPASIAQPISVRTLVPGAPKAGPEAGNSGEETQFIRRGSVAPRASNGEEAQRLPSGVYQTKNSAEKNGKTHLPSAGRTGQDEILTPPDEATLVLPLSNTPWAVKLRKSGRSGDKNAENGSK